MTLLLSLIRIVLALVCLAFLRVCCFLNIFLLLINFIHFYLSLRAAQR